MLEIVYEDFGFPKESIDVKLSTRPEKRLGDDATWDRAEKALGDACKAAGFDYEISEGEGAFYGPKLEFTLYDSLGRAWQCGTLQLDYQLPSKERLNAEYIGEDNDRHNAVMLHRAVLGSLERFIGILIETYSGALPVWLSPMQVAVIPVAPAFNEYAESVSVDLQKKGIRSFADLGNDRMNAKIRTWQEQKIPYQLIVGQKELDTHSVAVRLRKGKAQNTMSYADFEKYIIEKIDTHAIED